MREEKQEGGGETASKKCQVSSLAFFLIPSMLRRSTQIRSFTIALEVSGERTHTRRWLRTQLCMLQDLFLQYVTVFDDLVGYETSKTLLLNHTHLFLVLLRMSPVWLTTQNHSTLVTERSAVPFLPVNPEYSATRNQVNQHIWALLLNA